MEQKGDAKEERWAQHGRGGGRVGGCAVSGILLGKSWLGYNIIHARLDACRYDTAASGV